MADKHVAGPTSLLRELNLDYETKQKNVARLKREWEEAQREAWKAEYDLRVNIMVQARQECLQLAETMCRKLPVELRECILTYLCIEEQPILVGPYYHHRPYAENAWPSAAVLGCYVTQSDNDDIERSLIGNETRDLIHLPDGTVKELHEAAPPSDMLMPTAHIFNPKYMGEALACESYQFYLQHNTFCVCNVDDALSAFLNPEAFGNDMSDTSRNKAIAGSMGYNMEMGVSPYMYVRNLQIRIKCEHFGFQRGQDHFNDLTRPTASEGYASERQFLRQVGESLRKLGDLYMSSAQINIEIIVMTAFAHHRKLMVRSNEEKRMLNLLETIRPSVYNLKHNVKYGQTKFGVKVIHHDDGLFSFPRDITAYFSLTAEQWTHEQSTNRRSGFPPQEFYVAPDDIDESQVLMGFAATEFAALKKERWGLTNVFTDKAPTLSVKEGKFWPNGKSEPGWDS